jgi:hypothetical protein
MDRETPSARQDTAHGMPSALRAAINAAMATVPSRLSPEGHAAFEDIALHRQLSVLPTQPGQLRPLIGTQRPVTLTTAALIGVHPVPERALVDPASRATWAIGFPVSRTSRTAPSRKSQSDFLRVSPVAVLLSGDGFTLRGEAHKGPVAQSHGEGFPVGMIEEEDRAGAVFGVPDCDDAGEVGGDFDAVTVAAAAGAGAPDGAGQIG